MEDKAMSDNTFFDNNSFSNYKVCNCNNVSYFEILDALEKQKHFDAVLEAYEKVRDTTKCSTGCGGCYDKVIEIISEAMS